MSDMVKQIEEILSKSRNETFYFRIDENGKLDSMEKTAAVTIDVSKLPGELEKNWLMWNKDSYDEDIRVQAKEILYALTH